MKFQEDIEIITETSTKEAPYVHFRDRPIKDLVNILREEHFDLDGKKSLVKYNSSEIALGTLSVPLRLWERISSEDGVVPYGIHFLGKYDLLGESHEFKLELEDKQSFDSRDHPIDLIEGTAVLETSNTGDYSRAVDVIGKINELISSVYEK